MSNKLEFESLHLFFQSEDLFKYYHFYSMTQISSNCLLIDNKTHRPTARSNARSNNNLMCKRENAARARHTRSKSCFPFSLSLFLGPSSTVVRAYYLISSYAASYAHENIIWILKYIYKFFLSPFLYHICHTSFISIWKLRKIIIINGYITYILIELSA